jgi:hypothetical protein
MIDTELGVEKRTAIQPTDTALYHFSGRDLAVLQKDWPKQMELANMREGGFCLRGVCPHCRRDAAFETVTKPYMEPTGAVIVGTQIVGALRCVACNDYILGILKMVPASHRGFTPAYKCHYPVEKPIQSDNEDIPKNIIDDFNEALRCKSVDAYNATAEMCRRALQASCLSLGADPKLSLDKQIEWLASQGKIIISLQQMAHKVRLGGNRGAHPPDDPSRESPLGPEEAEALVTFTWEYLKAIYVTPSELARFDFSRSASKKLKA